MMVLKRTYFTFLFMVLGTILSSCVEPFIAYTQKFERVLVIGGNITNELKQQQIFLAHTFTLEDDGPSGEENANVKVVESGGNEYLFSETVPGTYVSTIVFRAVPNRDYQLFVTTEDGMSYSSETMQLPTDTALGNLYAERITTDLGKDGIAIYVDSEDPTNSSKYYRYEYEETYKIIAPRWNSKELLVIEGENPSIDIVPRSMDEWVCYRTDISQNITLTASNELNEDRVTKFLVRFINRDNYILSHRYSILVRQYIQSLESYTFYETLRNFSGSESLFSETQPGFLTGNIFSDDDPDEKVLGYFDVSSVSEKRIFFDYIDFFDGERLPPFVDPCRVGAPIFGLLDLIRWDFIKYIKLNEGEISPGGPYLTVPQVCGDCTALGNPEIPEFWTE